MSVNPSRDGFFVVSAHHVYDDGTPEFWDVTEFTPDDADEYVGEGIDVGRHAEAEAALEAASAHGAVIDRWVNFGVIGDECADARGWS